MFVEEYILELRARRYSIPAGWTYLRKTAIRAKENAYANPNGVRSVLINALGFFLFFFMASVVLAIWVDGSLARQLIVWQSMWLGLGTTWLLLHLGLLRGSDGTPLARIGLPNQLSFLRLLLIPAIYLCIVEGHVRLAVLAYAVAGLSDILDGFVARRYGLDSRLGLVLDPIVDIGYTVSIFKALHTIGWIPTWLMVLVGLRYGLLWFGTAILYFALGRVTIKPTAFGKVSGVVITALNFLLLCFGLSGWLATGSDARAVVVMGLGFLFSAAVIQLVVIGLHNLRGGDSRTVVYTKVAGELPRPPARPRR